MVAPPIPLRYEGDGVFVPASPHWGRQADKHYTVGEILPMAPHEGRSANSHRHYFAAVNEAWQNLPEELAARFPTSEHLRKFALIKAGYRDERTFACASRAEAIRLAAFIRPIDDFAVVECSATVVTVLTAKSQSMRAMGRAEFQKSKDDALAVLAAMIDVAPETLSHEAGKAA